MLSPIPDETDLRTKSRDELVRMVLDIAAHRCQLEQKIDHLQEQVDAHRGALLSLKSPDEDAARIATLEAELAKARAELEEATAPKGSEDSAAKGKAKSK